MPARGYWPSALPQEAGAMMTHRILSLRTWTISTSLPQTTSASCSAFSILQGFRCCYHSSQTSSASTWYVTAWKSVLTMTAGFSISLMNAGNRHPTHSLVSCYVWSRMVCTPLGSKTRQQSKSCSASHLCQLAELPCLNTVACSGARCLYCQSKGSKKT